MALQHLRSSTAHKRPVPGNMSDGQLGINTNLASPGLFFKDTNGDLVKVGPVHVGTTAPNASPASGGTAGNSVGEQWLDTTGGTYVFKVWDGSAWRSETGTFVDVNGDVMTGALGIIAGSAATPGLYISGDTNTGLYSPGADQVAISTGGSGKLFVNNAGEVDVSSANARLYITTTGTNTAVATLRNASYYYNINLDGANGGLTFYNGTERLRITAAGLVGIGTSSVNKRLEIAGNNDAVTENNTLRFTDTDVSTEADQQIGKIEFYSSDASTPGAGVKAYIGAFAADTTPDAYLAFATQDGSTVSTPVERVRITSDGKVGIGTTNVNAKLEISGNSGGRGLRLSEPSGEELDISAGANPNDPARIATGLGSGIAFAVNGNSGESARIDSSGYLRLSTSSPGIQFNGDTAAANALNDYEEGTFTPTIVGTTSAGTGTYTNQIGRYTKIGNRVFFDLYLAWSAHTGTGDLQITGLPFTVQNTTNLNRTFSAIFSSVALTAGSIGAAFSAPNTTTILLRQMPTGGGAVATVPMDTSAQISISGSFDV